MKSLRITGLLIAVLVLSYLGLCAVLPSKIEVSLQKQIYARPEAVFYQLVCFKRWENWLAQKKLAPDTKFTYKDKDCWLNAHVQMHSVTFGDESITIDSLSRNSFLVATYNSSKLANGLLRYSLIPSGKTTNLKLEFESEEVSFLQRPFLALDYGSVQEVFNQNIQGLKREAELNLLEAVEVYDYEIPITKKKVEVFKIAVFEAKVSKSGAFQFVQEALALFDELEKRKELKLGKTFYVGTTVGDSIVKAFVGKEVLKGVVSTSELKIKEIKEEFVLVSKITGLHNLGEVTSAIELYAFNNGLKTEPLRRYEFDGEIEIDKEEFFKPDRVVIPLKAMN